MVQNAVTSITFNTNLLGQQPWYFWFPRTFLQMYFLYICVHEKQNIYVSFPVSGKRVYSFYALQMVRNESHGKQPQGSKIGRQESIHRNQRKLGFICLLERQPKAFIKAEAFMNCYGDLSGSVAQLPKTITCIFEQFSYV